ncbi:hypothetical protein I302_107097 [Kwoniella bestiolae CBS 10118]|uniref:FAD-binding domain-containing protein n=1 Tax=Kwoniella bestiolae CBS 10118 TaxID=1296100 RepID=A0A1B9FZJ1_9TREE|nr:hypothetical protein I302_05638 [Kwoniella bestiolae CBS 10118]OCF24179.1 hypothetical protein I302_05638 [Kwoniella bestiolae CBS 10118]
MSNLKVLVCGASIAGPATAYWLSRAGAQVTVIERFPRLRSSGHNVDIRNLGVSVMRKMEGMEEAVLKKKLDLRGISIVNPRGGNYGVLGSAEKRESEQNTQSLLSDYEIYRGDLSQILVDLSLARQNVNYVFGEEVSSIVSRPGDGQLTVGFKNGRLPQAEYDLVVDCGGATSRTRAIGLGLNGEKNREYVHLVHSWTANFSIPKGPEDNGNIALAHGAPGGRVIFLDTTQPDSTKVVLSRWASSEADSDNEAFRQALEAGETRLKTFVSEVFRGSGWREEEILKGMMDSRDFYAGEWVQVKLPRLYSDKVNFALVGDAGYGPGPTGGGTSLALTGAYILAGELLSHEKEWIQAGLKAYNDRMRPIIDDLQKTPPFVRTAMAPQTSSGIWLRNRIFSFLTWSKLLEVMGKYVAPAFQSGERYKLPEYTWRD